MNSLTLTDVSLLAAFGAGIISFISPCVLPIIPGYISFISGVSVEDMGNISRKREVLKKVTLNSVFFVLGFSVVFVLLGATASFIGKFLISKLPLLNKIAGVIIVIFGLHLMGIFKIPFLNYEKRFHSETKGLGYLGSFVVGLAFAFGWTPCIGPILAGILTIAANQSTIGQGIILLSFYSLGLGLPFLITAVSFNTFLGAFSKVKKHFRTVELVSGAFLVLIGVLIFTNSLGIIARFLLKIFPWLNLG